MTQDRPFSLILGFGSETGNAQGLAKGFAEACQTIGITAEATELNRIKLQQLASASHFIVITSTSGEGEAPYNAYVFWDALSADDADRLEHLNFGVLSLGDVYYPLYANAGKIIDERLAELGATRLLDRIDCDVEFDEPAEAWSTDMLAVLKAATTGSVAPDAQPTAATATSVPVQRAHATWDRKHPYTAKLVINRTLTAAQSDKEVRHYEIDLGDSGITYHAGDALCVHPVNDPALVEAMLARLGASADQTVAGYDEPLGVLLEQRLEIRAPSPTLQALVASRTSDERAAAALGISDPAAHASWIYGRDVLDLLELAELSVAEAVATMRPLQYRDYSIASSPQVHPDSIHLTVATVRYELGGRHHGGVASTFLAERAEPRVQVHLAPNESFRLPDPDVPIIMVGPGTGIAPFRAFLQERAATGATGKSWLFFGDRRRATDFLYGEELTGFLESGVLTRLDLAFSREADTDPKKKYVQHHMRDNAAELFRWLQAGAVLYVCGDADHMAKDVDRTLHEIVTTAGGMDTAAAHTYVNELITNHRYLRDVY